MRPFGGVVGGPPELGSTGGLAPGDHAITRWRARRACMGLIELSASRIFGKFDGRQGGSVLKLQGSSFRFRDYLVKLRVGFHDERKLLFPWLTDD
jgi:hypothetical protein